MAYDFPNSPTVGDVYDHYTWDGEKWNITSGPTTLPDTTPNPFTFTDIGAATRSTLYTSAPIVLTGIDAPSPISVTGGSYSINGGSFTSASGMYPVGGSLRAQRMSSASYSTSLGVAVTVGGISDTFTITTGASPSAGPGPTLTRHPSTDSGVLSTDGITNIPVPTMVVDFTGTGAVAGDTMYTYRNGTELIATTSLTSGILAGGPIYYGGVTLNVGNNLITAKVDTVATGMSNMGSGATWVYDPTAPALLSPDFTPTGATTASAAVFTNEGNGTLVVEIKQGSTVVTAPSQTVTGIGLQGFSITGLSPSTAYNATFTHTDAAGNISTPVVSATFSTSATADTTAPVLTSPSASPTGSTTATLGVTTDEGNGTLYGVVVLTSTPPTKAQIKLGQNASGSAAVFAFNQAITTAGSKTASATGLTASTTYYVFFMHEDVATNQSNVPTVASFATGSGTVTYTKLDTTFGASAGDWTYSNSDRTATHAIHGGAGTFHTIRSVKGFTTGQKRFELTVNSYGTDAAIQVGFLMSTADMTAYIGSGGEGSSVDSAGDGYGTPLGYAAGFIPDIAVGDTVTFEIDYDAKIFRVAHNGGTWTADQSWSGMPGSGPWYAALSCIWYSNEAVTLNFGQLAWVKAATSGFTGMEA